MEQRPGFDPTRAQRGKKKAKKKKTPVFGGGSISPGWGHYLLLCYGHRALMEPGSQVHSVCIQSHGGPGILASYSAPTNLKLLRFKPTSEQNLTTYVAGPRFYKLLGFLKGPTTMNSQLKMHFSEPGVLSPL